MFYIPVNCVLDKIAFSQSRLDLTRLYYNIFDKMHLHIRPYGSACWVKTVADDIVKYYFYFSQKKDLNFMQMVSKGDRLHEMSKPILWEKIRKKKKKKKKKNQNVQRVVNNTIRFVSSWYRMPLCQHDVLSKSKIN